MRRSGRLKNATPDYTGETIDNFGEALDREAGRREPRQTRHVEDNEEMYREAVEDSMRWLEESRAALLSLGFADGGVPKEQGEWKKEAVRRWGHRVEDIHMEDWATYVQSRMSTPPPASPHDLLQVILIM